MDCVWVGEWDVEWGGGRRERRRGFDDVLLIDGIVCVVDGVWGGVCVECGECDGGDGVEDGCGVVLRCECERGGDEVFFVRVVVERVVGVIYDDLVWGVDY